MYKSTGMKYISVSETVWHIFSDAKKMFVDPKKSKHFVISYKDTMTPAANI